MLTASVVITTNYMEFRIDFVTQINQIERQHWQDLFASANPFTHYDYLFALEQSQCVSQQSGWQPFHIQVFLSDANKKKTLVALMPLYLKSHSYGEYMFDWSWADAYQKHGYEYYPKLVSAIPFTPVSGQRLAIAGEYEQNRAQILTAMTEALLVKSKELSISNVQCLFHQANDKQGFDAFNKLVSEKIPQAEANVDEHAAIWHPREDVQFHWFNKSYSSFDNFLLSMSARKRKNITKERIKVQQQGIYFEHLSGKDITAEHWQLFIKFYQMTYLKRSGHLGYLNLECFQLWADKLAEQQTLVVAKKYRQTGTKNIGDETIAAALFFHDQENLYGRYWGCLDEYDFLHFETCYYQGIEIAIQRQLACFNAGAQGEHKVARGFEPVITYGHYLLNASPFKAAIGDFLSRERLYHQEYRQDIAKKLPFKKPS